jgi:pimeloyl-ACP methyl ester carboxylesterase
MDRKVVALSAGDIAYAETGEGPTALFVHGVLVNADLWRHAMVQTSDLRRCVALDLPGHGASTLNAQADASLGGLAALLEEFSAALDLGAVDLVANDTGGAVAQVFAVTHPERIRTLTLTNCDVHDNFPPAAFAPLVELAKQGEFGPMVAAMAGDLGVARSEIGFAQGYQHPEELSDELLHSYLDPFVTDQGRALERILSEASADELVAIEPLLAKFRAPTQIVWGTGDLFFEPFWADRLQKMIPSVEQVTQVDGAMLFFPDERADELVPLLRHFWQAHLSW